MPDANGKLQLADYDAALIARGFDGYQQSERYQLINFGYRYVARKFPWSWEETSHDNVVNPGSYQIPIGGGLPLTISGVRGIDIVTDPYRQRLSPEREDQFRIVWQPLDLTAAKNQGIPVRYYVWANNIWLLPPPSVSVTVRVWFYQYLLDLVSATDVPATPQIVDEVILDAALMRAHRRAHEIQLSQEAQMRVDEAISDLLQSDVFVDEERQERVLPDSQWL